MTAECRAIMRPPPALAVSPPVRRASRAVRRFVRRLERTVFGPAGGQRTPGDERLRVSEERFHLAMLGATDGLWDWDLRTNAIYFSPRWKSMLGYEPHEIRDSFDEWRRRIHPDDLGRADATLRAYIEGESDHYELEHRLQHRDGSYRWIVARGAAVRDANGRVVRMAGSHADVTDRRRTEAALRQQERQYRSIVESTIDGLVINDLQTGLVVEVNPAFCRMLEFSRDELIGRHPHGFIDADGHSVFDEAVRAVSAGDEFRCRAVNRRKDGTPIEVEVHCSPISYGGRACLLAVVRDIGDRLRAFELLERRVDERTRELATLLDVSSSVTSTLDLQPLLGLILDQLKAVADYTGASLLTLEDGDLVIREARGASAEGGPVIGIRFPVVFGTPIADLISQRQPVIIADVLDDSVLAQAYRGAVGDLIDTPSFSYARSWMGVPMVLNGEVTGILSLSHAQTDFYTMRHANLAEAIANQAAIAIENARLYEQAGSLAAMEERQRLARELHDSVTQSLFSMTMISGALPRLMDKDLVRARERCERLHELATGALMEMRALIFELHPESLEREGLVAALERQAVALRARHGIAVECLLESDVDVPFEVQEALFRIAQEAMQNTVKHARARRLTLRLTDLDHAIAVEVCDDGIGFDPTGPFPGHFGHRSMRERAERLGGTLTITSAPEQGTCVRAEFPLSRDG